MPVQTKVDINSASREDLMAIDGIGETMADAIIRYRQQNGAFKSVEEIDDVPGIGESRLEYIKQSLSVSGSSSGSRSQGQFSSRSQSGGHESSSSRKSQSGGQSSGSKSESGSSHPGSRSSGHEKSGSHGGSHR